MAKILKFIYAMILFLFLFLVAMEVGGEQDGCVTDADCPRYWEELYVPKCIDHKCIGRWKWD
ncbi:unnamed protein product [Lathyrus oleraceus]|uniref:Nodule-specific cysteine-rich peptide G09 n=1 Tax=Pisum sativum TaxID=3888 RepID=A0A7T8IFW7_PEA|nr:nodule-specific cysteine-rich peptide G09 [Pisum sativum]